MKPIIFILSSFISMAAMAQQAEEFNYDKCMENAASTYEMNECAAKETAIQDKRLNASYKRAISVLTLDKSPESKEIIKRLRNAQRAWITARDADCSLLSVQMLGGTGEGMIYNSCFASETKKRADFMADFEKDYVVSSDK